MIHGQPKADLATSIKSSDRELIMVKLGHQRSKIIGDCSLRLLSMIISDRGFARPAIAAHVRTDNGEPGSY